ncbi:fibrobacter succinogenes major paralogous domain-containing protein [uncultured Fibrobacter sp.]|uniref:fibrobacter succinogenes major paralogous domain-containing protein n=1 Tax=uncultured Fibrobacter sp. TaxID=261512 RepID=UPI0025D8E536|nr:fibrobacter succinogenes major paralogous domain-containing protein [uncultured Fibrobacter sp.]
MKKFLVAMGLVAFAVVGCDDSSSASAENNEPAALSSAEKQGSSSSSRHCEECNDEAISSDSNAESNGSSRSSSSEKNAESSSSEKLSGASSDSADMMESSSSSVTLATRCKTETEDNCEYGTLLDDRDGQTYKTVKIGAQWWMAENLNFVTENSGCGGGSGTTEGNCETYGRLYTWAAAMDSVGEWSTNGRGCGYGSTCSPTLPVRGVCPKGWHLPRRSEWEALFTTVGGSSTAGKKLKSLTGWYNSSNGTDAYSFAALPAGLRDGYGHYEDEGYYAFFWSSTERNGYFAYSMALYYVNDNAFLYTYDYDNSNGFSVRCVKD